MKQTWDWLLTVMDSTEAQLRFGASLTHSSDLSHPGHPISTTVASTGKNKLQSNEVLKHFLLFQLPAVMLIQ